MAGTTKNHSVVEKVPLSVHAYLKVDSRGTDCCWLVEFVCQFLKQCKSPMAGGEHLPVIMLKPCYRMSAIVNSHRFAVSQYAFERCRPVPVGCEMPGGFECSRCGFSSMPESVDFMPGGGNFFYA